MQATKECKYGCGQPAIYQDRCSKSSNSCPKVKERKLIKKLGLEGYAKYLRDIELANLERDKADLLALQIFQLPFNKLNSVEKVRITTQVRYGVDSTTKLPWVQKQMRETTQVRYGVDNIAQSKEYQEAKKQEALKLWGVDNYAKTLKFKDQIKKVVANRSPEERARIRVQTDGTNLARYGAKAFTATDAGIQQVRVTSNQRYGKPNFSMTSEFKRKAIETSRRNWGVDYPMQSVEVRKLAVEGCLEAFGVTNCMHNQKIFERSIKNMGKGYYYTFPSGRKEYVQGYEGYVLNELLSSGFSEQDIVIGKRNMPKIYYEFEGKRRYYPDIFIPRLNWILEVKSPVTLVVNRSGERIWEQNLAKRKACLDLGLKFNFIYRVPNMLKGFYAGVRYPLKFL